VGVGVEPSVSVGVNVFVGVGVKLSIGVGVRVSLLVGVGVRVFVGVDVTPSTHAEQSDRIFVLSFIDRIELLILCFDLSCIL
jgi:hypothetical protein